MASPTKGKIKSEAQKVNLSKVKISKVGPKRMRGSGVVPPVPRNNAIKTEIPSGQSAVLRDLLIT